MANLDVNTVALSGESGEEVESLKSSQTNKAELSTPPTSSSPVKKKRQKSPASKKRAIASTEDGERVVKKSKRHESEEEGEASSLPTSPPSLRSASMSESASDDSPTGGKSQALRFPVDGKFASEAEKAQVMALPEVKREEILAERATMIERDQQNRMLIQLLRQKGRPDVKDTKDNKDTKETDAVAIVPTTAEKKKRKAPAADLEENQRKSTRQKTTLGGRKVGEASAPLEEYKKQREQREAQIEQKKKEDATKVKAQKKVDENFDADAEGESEDDWDGGKRPKTATTTPTKAPAAKTAVKTATKNTTKTATKTATPPQQAPVPIIRQEEPADLQDFNRARFGRAGFGQYCYHPGFEEAITGCIVRIATGEDRAGQNRYSVGQIKRFTEGKAYAIAGPTGSRFVTTQYLVAAQGKTDREFPFIFCSDSKLTQAELDRFKKYCTDDSVPIPTKSFLIKKVEDINRFIHRKMTDAELNEKLRRSGVQARRIAPILRAQLRTRREAAITRGDEAAIAQCDAELAKINGPKLAFGTKLYDDAPEKKEPDVQDRVAAINERNRKLNSIEIRKAQLRERKAAREHEERVARGEAQPDPFARVKTRARIMHDAYAHLPKPFNPKKDLDDLFEDTTENSGTVTPQTQEPTPAAKKVEAAPFKKINWKDIELQKPLRHPFSNNGPTDKKMPYSMIIQEPTFEDYLAAQDSGLDSDLELP